MKKVLCIISLLLCIFLAACGEDKSIGIIDWPYEVEKSNVFKRRMFKKRLILHIKESSFR